MNQTSLRNVQQKVEVFFQDRSSHPLSVVAQDCCSEMTRLVGSWVLVDDPTVEVVILKGVGIQQTTHRSHEILAVRTDSRFTLIDPTIWQLFPDASSIIVGEAETVSLSFSLLEEKYGGTWKVNEEPASISAKDVHELERILGQTIHENVRFK